ncbi:hypothetical protein BJX64DRAFT_270544 [Aspergillus heterothallicus]
MHRQIAPPIFAIALLSSVGVSLAQPPTPTTQPTGFLHPTPGETVTVGELYTISWSPPPPSPPGPLALEIKGTNAYIRPLLVNRTIGCDGYMANTHCDKFNMGIEEGETEFGEICVYFYSHSKLKLSRFSLLLMDSGRATVWPRLLH